MEERGESSVQNVPTQVVQVVELGSEDLELEHQKELQRELEAANIAEATHSEDGKGKAVMSNYESAPEPEPEPESSIMEPSYQALKLALSLSEGQLENKRRRMSCIDEEGVSVTGPKSLGHVGHQLSTGHQGHSTEEEALAQSNTPIYDKLKQIDPASVLAGPLTQSANQEVKQGRPTHPTSPLDTRPMVPSPLRNEESSEDQVLTSMPSLHEELSAGSKSRSFFRRRTLRSTARGASNTKEKKKEKKNEKEAPILPSGPTRGESPTGAPDADAKPSPITTFLAEAAKRSGELRRRVSGGRPRKPTLTRLQRQESVDRAQRAQTADSASGPEATVQESPTAMLAAMLAVGATAVAAPITVETVQEQVTVLQAQEQVLSEPVPVSMPVPESEGNKIEDGAETAPVEAASSSRFFRRRSLRSAASRRSPSILTKTITAHVSPNIPTKQIPTGMSIPTKLNPTRHQAEEPAPVPSTVPLNVVADSSTNLGPRPVTIKVPKTAPKAQSPLEPKPRTHIHFSRKRQDSNCTLCTPEYLLSGTVPDLASTPEHTHQTQSQFLEPAPSPTVTMAADTKSRTIPTKQSKSPQLSLFPVPRKTTAKTGPESLSGGVSEHAAKIAAKKQAEADIRTSSFRRLPSRIPRMARVNHANKTSQGLSSRSLRKPAGGAQTETVEDSTKRSEKMKSKDNPGPRQTNPFRRNSRSAQPELPMLALAMATPPSKTSLVTSPETQVKAPTHIATSTTPLSQQRFLRKRSLRTQPTTPLLGTPPLPEGNSLGDAPLINRTTETDNRQPDSQEAATDTGKHFFRKRSLRNAPTIPGVAKRVRFSTSKTYSASTESTVVPNLDASTHASTGFFRRRSLRTSSAQANEEDVSAAPLHVFEPLPRRFSVTEAEAKIKSRRTNWKSLRSRSAAKFMRQRSPRSTPGVKEPTRVPPPPPQDAPSGTTAALPPSSLENAGNTVIVAESKRFKLQSRLFRGRSVRAAPRAPARTPPALPPRNKPQLPGAVTAPEDEITPVRENKNEKVDGTGIAVKSGLQYVRDSKKLTTYLIPLPMPILKTGAVDEEDIPQRFLIYTPPAPHLLKPIPKAGETIKKRNQIRRIQREGKRHWAKRKIQEQIRKAQTHDGKTLSIRGIHSKLIRGVIRAVRRIRITDIVFLNRVNRKEVEEIHLLHPPTSAPTPELRAELLTQLALTNRRAFKQALLSTLLLPITLIIDTLAIPVWPFGGLFEIDAIWTYSSIKGWYTSRSLIRRLSPRSSRLGRFASEKKALRLVFEDREETRVFERYVAELCHELDPSRFPSVEVPPGEGEVERAIGWGPAVRDSVMGSAAAEGKGKEKERIVSGDEEVQRLAFRDDLKATAERGARTWRKSCEKYEKRAEKAATRWPSCS